MKNNKKALDQCKTFLKNKVFKLKNKSLRNATPNVSFQDMENPKNNTEYQSLLILLYLCVEDLHKNYNMYTYAQQKRINYKFISKFSLPECYDYSSITHIKNIREHINYLQDLEHCGEILSTNFKFYEPKDKCRIVRIKDKRKSDIVNDNNRFFIDFDENDNNIVIGA